MTTMDALLTRRSCRGFSDKPVTEEQMQQLLVAANAAPVGRGMFENVALSVIRNRELFSRMEAAMKQMAPDYPNPHPLYNAPAGILVCVPGEPVADVDWMNAACVMENILLAATDMGLGSTFIMGAVAAMRLHPELCEAAKVPAGFVPVCMAIVGTEATEAARREPTTEKFAVAWI